MPPSDFFDEEWEEPSRTQETAVTPPPRRRIRGSEAAARSIRRLGERARSRPGDDDDGEPPRGPVRRPRRPPRRSPEWGRIAMLAVGAVVIVILFVLLVSRCGGSGAEGANQDYFDSVTAVTRTSDEAARTVRQVLGGQPRPLPQIQAGLREALQQSQQAATDAESLEPTGEVETFQPALLSTLGYRVNGVECLVDNIGRAYRARGVERAGRALVPCMQRLLASDVVYDDSFANPSRRALRADDLNVRVPESDFLRRGDEVFVTPRGIGLALQRLKPQTNASGLHGLSLDRVVVDPGGTALEPGSDLNQVAVTDDMAFVVSTTNGGNFQEAGIQVALTIGTGESRIQKTATIERIAPKETAQVRFTDIFSPDNPPNFGQPTRLAVRIAPVPGERTATNNAASYTITPVVASG